MYNDPTREPQWIDFYPSPASPHGAKSPKSSECFCFCTRKDGKPEVRKSPGADAIPVYSLDQIELTTFASLRISSYEFVRVWGMYGPKDDALGMILMLLLGMMRVSAPSSEWESEMRLYSTPLWRIPYTRR